jgi:4'-phosphopantetheinyl transferase
MKSEEVHIFWTKIQEQDVTKELVLDSNKIVIQPRKLVHQTTFQKYPSLVGKYLLVEGLERLALTNRYFPVELDYRSNGKPFLQNLGVDFSISHSGSIVVCAIATQSIGIDIQQKVAIIKGSERLFLKQTEIDIYPNPDFLKLWSQKEATYKGFGYNFSAKLSDFQFISSDILQYKNEKIQTYTVEIDMDFHCIVAEKMGQNYQKMLHYVAL